MMPAYSILLSLADVAARSLLLAGAVGAGLWLLRARNVVAQKTAWLLVLAASLAMPLLARWAERAAWLPDKDTVLVTGRRWTSNTAGSHAPALAITSTTVVLRDPDATPGAQVSVAAAQPSTSVRRAAGNVPAPAAAQVQGDRASQVSVAAPASPPRFVPDPAWTLLGVYLAICCALLTRLAYGSWAAARLWRNATPVPAKWSTSAGLRLRSSSAVASPVTVGSGIVLPADYEDWAEEKLRIVLAHEGSHVRQHDFYVQLAATIHIALFWFSPLGWWLRRKLSDLSETISDGAAVQEAASHASYAQVLLEFAALPRPIPIGVAMAHRGRLLPRIERLLNESSFRQAFAGGRARLAAAVLLVPASLFFSTTMVRVKAAGQQTPPPTVAPYPAAAPQAAPQSSPAPDAQAPAADPPAPLPPSGPGTTVVPQNAPSNAVPAPLPPPSAEGLDAAGQGSSVFVAPPPASPYYFAVPNVKILARNAQALAMLQVQKARAMALDGQGYFRYGLGNDGNSYAYVTGVGDKNIHYSGNGYDRSRDEIEKARTAAHGDFLWFLRDGKSYVIDDPAALAQLKPMQDQMDELGKQQEELRKQQEALGQQQEALGKKQEEARVPTPDVSKEMADLNAAIAKLDAKRGGTVSQEDLADLQGKTADLEGKLGSLEGEMGAKQGEIGRQQGELGAQQGKLGAQQGRLGAQQGRLAREMDGKTLSIIDECMKDGKARPVQ